MYKSIVIGLSLMLVIGAPNLALADEAIASDAAASQVKVNDDEVKPGLSQDVEQPQTPTKSKLRKPKIGFKNTVSPQDMKSYHRSESGDVSAQ